MVATALLCAERHVADQLTRGLSESQRSRPGRPAGDPSRPSRQQSGLGPTVTRGSRTSIPGASDRSVAAPSTDRDRPCHHGGRPFRPIRQLAREGTRLTAQHLKTLSSGRRRAVLVVTVLETMARLTDEAIGVFDRSIGQLFRRAERRASRRPSARCPSRQRQGAAVHPGSVTPCWPENTNCQLL